MRKRRNSNTIPSSPNQNFTGSGYVHACLAHIELIAHERVGSWHGLSFFDKLKLNEIIITNNVRENERKEISK